ncbi:MAG: ATP-binding protein [Planctomycetota bacterium]|jgi:signal transduction histidine kinase/pSer/pThr/pTyr-binding forkhead associated (FHA) protein
MAHLLIKSEHHGDVKVALGDAPVFIGRSADKDICLRDLTVSNSHAKVVFDGVDYWARDLHSTNGSFVNDEQITERQLTDGDELRIGNTRIVFAAARPEPGLDTPDGRSGRVAEDRASYDEFGSTVALTLAEIQSGVFDSGEIVRQAEQSDSSLAAAKLQQRITILYKLGQAAKVERLDKFLPKLIDLIKEAVGGERTFVMLIDPTSGDLVPRAYGGPPEGDSKGVSSTILNRVINEREAVLTLNALTDPKYSAAMSVAMMRIGGVMCVPLVSGRAGRPNGMRGVFGAIYVDTLNEESTFTKDDLQLLGVMGTQASVFLHNIQLWEGQRAVNIELARAREELKELNQGLELKVRERTKEISAQAAEIRELADTKDELMGMVAHDLRTPLTIIHGYAQLLRSMADADAFDPNEFGEEIEAIERTAFEMTTLLNDLLDVSKIEAGRIKISPVKTNIADLIKNAYQFHRPWATSKNVKLVTDIRPKLPRVVCDPKRIGQVLNNLISNAIKFSREKDSITIGARVIEEINSFEVAVTDTGEGIDPEDLPGLFGRYSQAKTKATKGEKGVGLGLAIAKKLVEMHGGEISVNSVKGHGSRFSFILPLG